MGFPFILWALHQGLSFSFAHSSQQGNKELTGSRARVSWLTMGFSGWGLGELSMTGLVSAIFRSLSRCYFLREEYSSSCLGCSMPSAQAFVVPGCRTDPWKNSWLCPKTMTLESVTFPRPLQGDLSGTPLGQTSSTCFYQLPPQICFSGSRQVLSCHGTRSSRPSLYHY